MAAGSDEQCPSNKVQTLYIDYLEASLQIKVMILSTIILKVNNLEEMFTLRQQPIETHRRTFVIMSAQI